MGYLAKQVKDSWEILIDLTKLIKIFMLDYLSISSFSSTFVIV